MSLVLSFDCAVSGLGIAIVRDGIRLAGLAEGGRDQAARLLPAIETALGAAGVGRRDLSLIAVTIGPGSFTGVRVAASQRYSPSPSGSCRTCPTSDVAGAPRAAIRRCRHRQPPRDWFCAIAGRGTGAVRRAGPSARLAGRACLVVGSGTSACAAARRGWHRRGGRRGFARPVILARLAADATSGRMPAAREVYRVRSYLRGVSITLPDGAADGRLNGR